MPTQPAGDRQRYLDEGGAVAAEHVAAVVVVAALIAAVWATGIHTTVHEWAVYGSCQLFNSDGDCERPEGGDTVLAEGPGSTAATDTAGPPVCTLTSNSTDRRRSTDWIFTRNVDGERYSMTQLSDGSVVILDTTYEGSGRSAGVGFDIPLGAKDKFGVSVSGHLTDVEESGRMFVLTPEAFEEYRDTMAAIAVDMYVNGPAYLDRALGGQANSFEEWMDDLDALAMRDRVIQQMIEQHVTHDYVRTTDELSLSLGGSYKVFSGSTTHTGSGSKVVAVDRESGDYTISFQMDAEIASQLGAGVLGVGAGVDWSGSGDASVTLEFSADDELMGASVTTGVEVGGGGYVGLNPGSIPGSTANGIQTSGGMGVSLNGAGRVETTFSLDLASDDGRGAQQIAAFLDDPLGNLDQLIDVTSRNGSVLMQGYEVTENSDSLDLAIRILAQAGISDTRSERQLRAVDAVSYDDVHGLQHRRDCVG